jgi:hypothetical protein
MDTFLEYLLQQRDFLCSMDMCVERRIRLDQLDHIIREYKIYLVIEDNKKSKD